MEFSLNKQQKQLQETIINFAQSELNQDIFVRDEKEEFNYSLWQKCGELNLQGLAIPKDYGGRGLNAFDTTLALEALGYGCEDTGLSFSIAAHLLACVVPIWKFGSESLKEKYLPNLCNGKLIAANSITERNSGSDIYNMETNAIPKNGGFVITGHKYLISNAPVSDLSLVYAVTDKNKGFFGGITAFIVETNTKGFKTDKKLSKLGLRTTQMGEQIFDKVYVSESQIVGKIGGGGVIFNHSMEWEKICLTAIHIGILQRIIEKLVVYVNHRESSGKSIGKYQSISHKIAEMKVQLETGKLLNYQSAWKLDRQKNLSMDAAMTKFYISESLKKATLDALQIIGGSGYLSNSNWERYVRDALSSTIYSGTSEIQLNIIAKYLGIR